MVRGGGGHAFNIVTPLVLILTTSLLSMFLFYYLQRILSSYCGFYSFLFSYYLIASFLFFCQRSLSVCSLLWFFTAGFTSYLGAF